MEKRQLGNTNIEFSRILFGAWAIGGWMWGHSNEKDAIEAIEASIENGVNTIDTAAIYGMGLSEQIVAKAIKGKRDQVIVATKCGMRWDSDEGSDPWMQKDLSGNDIVIRKNAKPDSIFFECEQSLKRLNVDVIDLYQLHWPDQSTPIEESWHAMVELKKQGKVRAIGVSNYNLDQLKRAHAIHPVDSMQPAYSLIRRDIENDIVPFCKENHITTLVYSPMERGLLTGNVTPERKFPKGDHRNDHPLFTPENRRKILEILAKIRPIADRHHVSLSQLVINCTLRFNRVDGAIVGARNAAQAIENANALSFQLNDQEVQWTVDLLNTFSLIKQQEIGAGR